MTQEREVSRHVSHHTTRQRMVNAVLEGWRCRQCYGIRSLHDLMKADGFCERCRFLLDLESYEVTGYDSGIPS